MSILYTIVLFAIIGVVIFFFYKEYTESRSYRIKRSVKDYRKMKKEEQESLVRLQKKGDEIISNEDRVMEIIRKIKTGEEVKIPIAAFQYIYTRLNQICVVDKDGTIQIVNSKAFQKFQETAIALLDKEKQLQENIINDNEKITSVFTTKKYEDGTIVKKNNVTSDITILKTDGTKYINKNKENDLTIERPEEKEDETKHNNNNKNKNKNSEDINAVKNKVKNLEQENTYLKKENEKNTNKKNTNGKSETSKDEKVDIQTSNKEGDSKNNSINKNENIVIKNEDIVQNISLDEQEKNFFKSFNNEKKSSIEETRKKLEESLQKKEKKKEKLKKENNFSTEEKDSTMGKENIDSPIDELDAIMKDFAPTFNKKSNRKKTRSAPHQVENNKDKKNIESDIKKENQKSSVSELIEKRKEMDSYDLENAFNKIEIFNYTNQKELADNIASGKNILSFIFHLLNIQNKDYGNYYVYDHKENKIYISVDVFIFKLSCYVKDKDREKLLKDLKTNGLKSCSFTESDIFYFIQKMNRILAMKLGIKPFYCNEEKKSFYVSRNTEFILGEEDKKYFKGSFLIFNIKNDFKSMLRDNGYLEKIKPNDNLIVDKHEGKVGLLHVQRIIDLKRKDN